MLIDIDEQIWILCSKDWILDPPNPSQGISCTWPFHYRNRSKCKIQETPHIAHVEYQLDVSFWCTQFLTPYPTIAWTLWNSEQTQFFSVDVLLNHFIKSGIVLLKSIISPSYFSHISWWYDSDMADLTIDFMVNSAIECIFSMVKSSPKILFEKWLPQPPWKPQVLLAISVMISATRLLTKVEMPISKSKNIICFENNHPFKAAFQGGTITKCSIHLLMLPPLFKCKIVS